MPLHADEFRLRFGATVSQTARLWRRAVDRRLQPFGLTEATWLPLLRLARATQPMRQKDLAADLSLDSSSVVRLLDELQAAGLIERREGADRRSKAIHLTRRGQETVSKVEAVAAEVRDEILGDVPAEDLRLAFGILDRLCRRLAAGEAEAPSSLDP